MIGGSRPIGVDRQGLLGGLCAAGEEYDVVILEAGQLRQTPDILGVAVATDAIELHRSGSDDRRGVERPESCRIGRRARTDERHLRQHPADQRGDAAVATKAPLAQSSVGHDDRQVIAPRRVEEMGPEFEFAEDEEVGVDGLDHAAHRPSEVEGAGEDDGRAKPFDGDIEAGRCGTGDDELDREPLGPGLGVDLAGERRQELDLADADTVEPDARNARFAAGQGSDPAGETQPRRRHRAPAGELSPCHPGQEHHEGDEVDEVEEHGGRDRRGTTRTRRATASRWSRCSSGRSSS